MWPFKRKEVAAPEPVKEPEKLKMAIRAESVAAIGPKPQREFQRYEPPKGVIPAAVERAILAMDSTDYSALNDAYSMGYGYGNLDSFPGIHIWQ